MSRSKHIERAREDDEDLYFHDAKLKPIEKQRRALIDALDETTVRLDSVSRTVDSAQADRSHYRYMAELADARAARLHAVIRAARHYVDNEALWSAFDGRKDTILNVLDRAKDA